MEVNKQRRIFLITSCLTFSGFYISGCSNSDEEKSSKNSTATSSIAEIIKHPVKQTITEGNTATFTVLAQGKPLSYQWQMNSINIPGATNESYTTPPVAVDDDGTIFTVIVTNPNGSVTSNPAMLVLVNTHITADSLFITTDSTLITVDRDFI